MLRRIALGLGLLLLVALVGIPLWIATHRTDLPDPGDADLLIALPELADADNGFTHVVRASQLMTLTDADGDKLLALVKGSESDPAWVRAKLRENRPAFAELERAIASPEMVLPDLEGSSDSHVFHPMFAAQRLARLASLEARLTLARGQTREALERSLLGLRCGAALMRARNPQLVSAMRAVALQSASMREARSIQSAGLDATEAARLSQELERDRASPESWRAVWAAEYQYQKTLMVGMDAEIVAHASNSAMSLLPRDFVWQRNRTLRLLAERNRAMGLAFSEPCVRGRGAFRPPEGTERGKLLATLIRGNGIGVILTAIATPSFEKFNLRRCHGETRLTLLEVELAARARGELPDPLPADPFGGEPLRFDRARGIVYSVGSDFAPNESFGPPSPDDEREPAIYAPLGGARAARR